MKEFNLLGVRVSAVNLEKAYAYMLDIIQRSQRTYVCVAPVSTIVDCQRLTKYNHIINGAGMVTPDGMPVVWCGQWQGYDVKRTYGPDVMLKTIDEGRAHHLKHFIYGSTPEVCDLFIQKMNARFPGALFVGAYAPEYTPAAKALDVTMMNMINNAKPDIVWVALGSPKQDIWMHLNRPFLHAPIMIGIGAAIDFISGVKPQAPRWMRAIGFEWLFRLCCEPKRLWKRYLIGNSLFIYYLLKGLCLNQSIAKPIPHKHDG